MKLLGYTNRVISFVVFVLMVVWGIIFYYVIINEVMDETDDTLVNTREIIVGKALQEPEFLQTEDTIMHRYKFQKITREQALQYRETFYDSTIYIRTEGEYEPVRVMKTCFRTADDSYYELELKISILERDDLIRAICWALFILYVLFLICTMASTYVGLKYVFKPLHRLLEWIHQVTPGKPAPPLDNDTKVREFRTLNEAALEMLHRIEGVYQEQKQFIENASHELQTPLAIIRGKLELLADSDEVTEHQLAYIDDMFSALNRVVQLNRSLLLLSRINNGQFPDSQKVSLNRLILDTKEIMEDIYEHKNIRIDFEAKQEVSLLINESLGQILITNLLKNALVHTSPGGTVRIVLNGDSLEFHNSGDTPLDSSLIFRRFYHKQGQNKESTGLGLAIVKSIADLYQMPLSYRYEGEHIFVLNYVNNEIVVQNS